MQERTWTQKHYCMENKISAEVTEASAIVGRPTNGRQERGLRNAPPKGRSVPGVGHSLRLEGCLRLSGQTKGSGDRRHTWGRGQGLRWKASEKDHLKEDLRPEKLWRA